jgi:hypothetical protein
MATKRGNKPVLVSQREAARCLDIPFKKMKVLMDAGGPVEVGGKVNVETFRNWMELRASTAHTNVDKREQKLDADIALVLQKVKKEEMANAKKRGELHPHELCASIRAAESRLLHSLGSRLAAQFPEIGVRLKKACDDEVDAIIEKLRNVEVSDES